MAWLAQHALRAEVGILPITIMKGLVTPFSLLQSREHRVLDSSYVELSVLISTG